MSVATNLPISYLAHAARADLKGTAVPERTLQNGLTQFYRRQLKKWSFSVASHFKYKEFAPSLYLALTLIPLIRIISVSIPLQGIPEVFGFVVVSVPLFIAGTKVAKMVGLTYAALGFSFERLHI